MRTSFPIDRLCGFQLRLDVSWFVLVTVLTWSLASQHYPKDLPDWSAESLAQFLRVVRGERAGTLG